ncbi:hypothetical protein MINS_12710 [Mycolicibacterium insubricum]|nr:hypothetical protein MINS_12710 [Mycolicibacterium insubricum]
MLVGRSGVIDRIAIGTLHFAPPFEGDTRILRLFVMRITSSRNRAAVSGERYTPSALPLRQTA